MAHVALQATELRVLVGAPFGRDAQVTCELLRQEGIACAACPTLGAVAAELREGAGAILLTTEALATDGAAELGRVLGEQEQWSDVPLVFAAEQGNAHPGDFVRWLDRGAGVTILERPIRSVTLRTVLRAALQSRARQYQIRDLLQELRAHVERLDAEQVVRDRFVSLLAHDLRGPLSTAMTSARLLGSLGDARGEVARSAARIERSMFRMDRMIRDLLDANRLRAGEPLQVVLEPCDLVVVVHDALGDVEERRRGHVHVHGPDRLEGVWATEQLRRAVWNLVTNALKYGPPDGRVDVTVATEGDDVVLAVSDQGPGISAADQVRILEPFGRAPGAEGLARGWGLGLTLVRGCAEAHRGTLSIDSCGRGTTFSLRLPRDARSAPASEGPPFGRAPRSPPR